MEQPDLPEPYGTAGFARTIWISLTYQSHMEQPDLPGPYGTA